jgi:hypothetical protein
MAGSSSSSSSIWMEHALMQRSTDLITLPSLHIEGLITGSPFVELNKTSIIYSSTGYVANIDYSGRGWLSGKKNSFTATLAKEGKKPIYTISGQWSGDFVVKYSNNKVVKKKKKPLLFAQPGVWK